MIKTKTYIWILLIASLLANATPLRADSSTDREYQIKAAFIYNFIKFIDFPVEKIADDVDSITIGVIGDADYPIAFDPIKNKQVKGKNIVIKHFTEFDKLKELQKKNDSRWKETIKELKKLQVLLVCFCKDEKPQIPVELLKALKDSGVLVIGEIPGFLENGGVINFVMENKKVRFEINAAAADRNGIKIRSQLLKLAKRVIKNKPQKEANN
ncbi:MAG: YfiR family protein [Planctomycetes bacterium]|nr:YfiR family protein [Planctomycetota bacterium]